MSDLEYDLAVIGAGPGGYVAAIKAAQLGLKVLLAERRETLGGTCLNIGCIPSKALLASSELFARIGGEAAEHGIRVPEATIDLAAMMRRKEKVVAKLTAGVSGLMKGNKVKVVHGEASVMRPGEVAAGGESFRAASILLATGSVPVELPALPFDHERIVDSSDALSFSSIPERLLVVGAGIIGLELGSVWARLGSEVEVVELLDDMLPGWDAQAVRAVRAQLTRQGLKFHFGTRVSGFRVEKDKTVLEAQDPAGKSLEFRGDKVLVAAGRRPDFGGIDLEDLGVKTEKGRIVVDSGFRTSVPGIYALGDLTAGPMLAHKAEEEGAALGELLAGRAGHVNYSCIPGVLYTQPEAAMVGKTEEELKASGTAYRKGIFQFAANGKALASGLTAGFVKVLSDKQSDRVLGVHIVGDHASDLIHEAVTVMEFRGSAEDLGRSVFAHPTLSEAVKEAALAAYDKAIHGLY
jgi:dihydrolipoyl dehydrogenase